jgi:tripartite-type tricarboxylate transporter receptor subunit TctC
MKSSRRKFLHLTAGAVALPALPRIARAQTYPLRPITLIVPSAAGGSADAIARVIAPSMTKSLGQNVIIENVAGADGSLGTGRVARARPDGYTLEYGFLGTHVFNGAYYSLPYDVLNDFTPISPLVATPVLFFARKTLPPNNLIELIAWLKANPNKATAGKTAVPFYFLMALFRKQTGTQFTIVPYRGGASALQDLLAGQIDLLVAASMAFLPLVRAGDIKAFAVTADTRMAMAPDIPTFAEMGLPVLSYSEWAALFAPKGTPPDIVGKLNVAAVEALADPAVRSRIADLGFEFFPREKQTAEALAAMQRADAEKWWPIIREFGLKVE